MVSYMGHVALLLLLISLSSVHCEFSRTVYTAKLSYASAVPSLGPIGAFGLAICIYDRNVEPAPIMDCTIQHNLDMNNGPYIASIYRGALGQFGTIVYQFDDASTQYIRQIFEINDINTVELPGYTAKMQEEDFLNGNWFIQLTSPDYVNGDIRGQLTHEAKIYARLSTETTGAQESSTGIATALYREQPSKLATFSVVHSVARPIGIEIHTGQRDEEGPVAYTFKQYLSPVLSEEIGYTHDNEQDLFDDLEYIQVNSLDYTKGEIRGQLNTIDYLPPVSFTSRLSGSSVRPNSVITTAQGCGLFSIDCDTFRLTYLLFHSVQQPTEAWMNYGGAYENGRHLFSLPRGESPIYGEALLSSDYVLSFYQQQLFVTVDSLLYPNGEIRGQITDTYDYYAYLTGTETIPVTTTSGLGCATFRLMEETMDGTVLDYNIQYTLPSFDSDFVVEMLRGQPGGAGTLEVEFEQITSPVSGTDVRLTDTQVNHFGAESMFIQVGPPSVFVEEAGYLRGQIYHIRNPCPLLTTLPEDPSTPTSSFDQIVLPSYFDWNGSSSLSPSVLSLLVSVVSLLVALLL